MHVDAGSLDEPVIVMTRTFDAPRSVVWAAFTDPKHVVRWYGGHGFSNEVREMDVRPGGLWRHVMRTPDGTAFEMEFVYVEVVEPEKLVWRNSSYGKAPPPPGQLNVINTVMLEDAGRQTKWRLVARFESIADRDLAAKKGFATVVTQGSEKLNDVVRALAPNSFGPAPRATNSEGAS
jgi:uncharacterized protein YndB with AHSA1/START domain